MHVLQIQYRTVQIGGNNKATLHYNSSLFLSVRIYSVQFLSALPPSLVACINFLLSLLHLAFPPLPFLRPPSLKFWMKEERELFIGGGGKGEERDKVFEASTWGLRWVGGEEEEEKQHQSLLSLAWLTKKRQWQYAKIFSPFLPFQSRKINCPEWICILCS